MRTGLLLLEDTGFDRAKSATDILLDNWKVFSFTYTETGERAKTLRCR